MIPTSGTDVNPVVPEDASFWVPGEEALDSDEGFAFFRDTWVIRDVDAAEAREVLDAEREILAVVDRLATTAEEFDGICAAVESGDTDELARYSAGELDCYADIPVTGGLEIGVAGAVYALSAAGAFPAASCRGHPGNAWATNPVVYIAVDRMHNARIAAAVRSVGCGFGIGPGRSELLYVNAPSVVQMTRLAAALLEEINA